MLDTLLYFQKPLSQQKQVRLPKRTNWMQLWQNSLHWEILRRKT